MIQSFFGITEIMKPGFRATASMDLSLIELPFLRSSFGSQAGVVAHQHTHFRQTSGEYTSASAYEGAQISAGVQASRLGVYLSGATMLAGFQVRKLGFVPGGALIFGWSSGR